jgi:hypothetical protein
LKLEMSTLWPLTRTWPWLTNWRAAARVLVKAEVIDDAVEPGLEELQEPFAGDAALPFGDREHAAELALEQAVDVAGLLLLIEADGVFRHLAARLGAVLAGREIAAFEGLAGAKNELAEAAADASGGTDIAGHG